jgi:hypothetical protein
MCDQERSVTNFQCGIGSAPVLSTLKHHYAALATMYRHKGMQQEADLFTEVVKELTEIERKITALTKHQLMPEVHLLETTESLPEL